MSIPLPATLAIGDYIPALKGHYAGIAGDLEGGAPGHLVLLDKQPSKRLRWTAGRDWAAGLGDGARLPTKAEGALLFANLKDKFSAEWHWLLTQYSDGDAYCQDFNDGYQGDGYKNTEGRCRAVRRFPLQSFSPLELGSVAQEEAVAA